MTADPFYGGVSNRLQNLRAMLEYIHDEHPSRDQLRSWVISHTNASSGEAVDHNLAFLNSIDLIELTELRCELGEYGRRWLKDQNSETLYDALSTGVKGFESILDSLSKGPLTDEDIMDLLVSEFDEAEMSTPGPAIRHREWIQVLGFLTRTDGVNRLTEEGRELVELRKADDSSVPTSARSPPPNVSVGDQLLKEDIEQAFDTGFDYRISGINPRRDEQDRRYILLFANEDGPYNDSVTQGRFEYIGEGLSGDQSESSPGNSALIDACTSGITVHFFYKRVEGENWEYQGLVDVLDYTFQQQDGREVLVFTAEYRHQSDEPDLTEEAINRARSELQRAAESEPQLTDDDVQYTERRRRARAAAFTQLVRDTYDGRCAVCGSKRESPDGTPEIEATHVYPKQEGGSDDVRNGIALCKLHHWAFESGWLSLTDDHNILVKETPDWSDYHEFKQLEGRQIRLPNEEDAAPRPMFLEEHRWLHAFNDEL